MNRTALSARRSVRSALTLPDPVPPPAGDRPQSSPSEQRASPPTERIAVKALIKKASRRLGYEIQRRNRSSPQWPQPDGPAPTDEMLAGPWFYHVLQMANRYYRPRTLRYHRTIYGEDSRLKYIAHFLDVRGQRVLEIGPLEGHHSVILEKMGVRENIAIESRADNLFKCQRIKEKYHLDHTQFLQCDLERLYRGEYVPSFSGPFDLVFCLGVLYHLPDPGRGLEWMRSQSNILFLGTHYCEGNSNIDYSDYSYGGKSYRGHEVVEGGIGDPISGMSRTSLWLCEDDLLRLIQDVGYSRAWVLGKDLQNGWPHITILAEA